MQIERIPVGELRANCYVLTKNNKSIILDPGGDANKIVSACEGKNVVGILVTHHHFDHVDALKEIEDYYNLKASIRIDGFNIEVIKTPGHTEDSLTFYFPEDKVMFTGDFLFKGTIGRIDLPTGSFIDMKESLAKISKYPKDITVYPGHGFSTTLGEEVSNFDYYLS